MADSSDTSSSGRFRQGFYLDGETLLLFIGSVQEAAGLRQPFSAVLDLITQGRWPQLSYKKKKKFPLSCKSREDV
ncbi:rCG23040 [Rattus norvegicus]|uniref:RCG23040 n=1 Tax=Rattus norvegicus TaxID=10116 RepID=A6KTZ9_RAT|nr:rCG23040 [Rattus norvegicus]